MANVNIQTLFVPTVARNGRNYDTGTGSTTVSVGGGASVAGTSLTVNATTPNGLSIASSVLSVSLASASTIGVLSTTDYTAFTNKEPAIATGTTSQYWRGDKTWATLPTSLPASSCAWSVITGAPTSYPASSCAWSVITGVPAFAPIASPTFTGTVSGITAAMVGLGNCNNTSDSAKPISTATATALAALAPISSPVFTGTATSPTFQGQTFNITNSSGTLQWTVSVNSSNNLQFLNAFGVVEAVLTQAGTLSVKNDVTAFATI